MKISKRIIALVLSIVFIFLFSFAYIFSVSAAEKNTLEGGVYYPSSSLLAQASNTGSSGTMLNTQNYLSNFSASMTANYFDQLDAGQKAIYNGLKALTPNSSDVTITLASPITFTAAAIPPTDAEKQPAFDEISSMTQTALDALLRDYPEIFWLKFGSGGSTIGWNFQYISSGSIYTCTVTEITFHPVAADSYASAAASSYSALQNAVSSFSVTGATRYLELKSIHDSLASLVTYNASTAHPYDAYGALIDHQAVCQGYAEAFKLLCDRENIPCILVSGSGVTTQGTEPHMWNYVQMEDGSWYAVDVTWDDQVTVTYDDFFLTGANSADPDYGTMTFSSSHIASGVFSTDGKTFTYPALSLAAYAPSQYDLTGETTTTATTATSAVLTTTTTEALTTTAETTQTTTTTAATTTTATLTTTTAAPATTTAASATTSATAAPTTTTAAPAVIDTSATAVPSTAATASSGTDTATSAVTDTNAETTSVTASATDISTTSEPTSSNAEITAATTDVDLISSITNPVTGESTFIVCAAVLLAAASGAVIALKKK